MKFEHIFRRPFKNYSRSTPNPNPNANLAVERVPECITLRNFSSSPFTLRRYEGLFFENLLKTSLYYCWFAMKNLFFLERIYCKNDFRVLFHVTVFLIFAQMLSRGGRVHCNKRNFGQKSTK